MMNRIQVYIKQTFHLFIVCLVMLTQLCDINCRAATNFDEEWHQYTAEFISAFRSKNYTRAEEKAKSAVNISMLNPYPDIRFRLISMQNLMRLYLYKKRYAEAAEISLKIIAMSTEEFGEYHIKTIDNLSELADIYMLDGQFTEAIKINKKVYDIRYELLGDDHIDSLITLNNLVLLASRIGDKDLSERYSNTLLEGYKKRLSKQSTNNLSIGLSPQELFDQGAERTIEETEKILMTSGIEDDYSVVSKKLKQKEMQHSFKTGKPMSLDDWTLSFVKEKNKHKINDLDSIKELDSYDSLIPAALAEPTPPLPVAESDYKLLRYPTIEAPEKVSVDQDIMVMVSLTEKLISPEVNIGSVNDTMAKKTAEGSLELNLPEEDEWKIDVVLNASGFNIADGNIRSILLKKNGDSTIALFRLHSQSIPTQEYLSKLYVSYIYKGQFISRVSKEITIINADLIVANPGSNYSSEPDKTTRQADTAKKIHFNDALETADLTILVRELDNADQSASTTITVISPYLQPMSREYKTVPQLSQWINSKYAKFSRTIPRGVALANEPQVNASNKEHAIPLMKGFGNELYNKFAPDIFKEAYWKLVDKKKNAFDSIQIYTNNPVLPWELMKPVRADKSEEHDFIGINYNIARWHVTENSRIEEKPPLSLHIKRFFVIAPENQQQVSLPWQKKEIENLSQIQQYQKISGKYNSVKDFFEEKPGGIIHFAGHGAITKNYNDVYEYSLYLDDQALDLDTWKGIMPTRSTAHPLYFINSCIVGQSHRIANMVDGWAPTMLEAGASGYIGALWPVGDQGASHFSIQFYQYLKEDLKTHPANIAEAIKKTRKLFYETGDPTFLSYIFYGDPNFNITMSALESPRQ